MKQAYVNVYVKYFASIIFKFIENIFLLPNTLALANIGRNRKGKPVDDQNLSRFSYNKKHTEPIFCLQFPVLTLFDQSYTE